MAAELRECWCVWQDLGSCVSALSTGAGESVAEASACASDRVFAAESIEVRRSAPQCPRMNAYAERWVRTIRAECTDRMLLLGRCHLERVLGEYVKHYNTGRAHRALDLRAPLDAPNVVPFPTARIARKPVLDGLINEYEAAA
jgi:transposase InsO family protein